MSAQFDFTQAPPKIEQIKVNGSFYNQSASEKQGLVNPQLVASWARNTEEVREAQSLRYQVFGVEMGANLRTLVPGHDVDIFDDFCEHLLVRDSAFGRVIGTYRVLTPTQAKRIGGTYTDEEFDLTRLRDIRSQMVEVGRSCVHPDYRKGVVILSLWRALTLFMRSNDLHIMIGCGTIPLRRTSLHNEPTYEGLTRLFFEGQPSLGIFSDEGGQFLGGHGMNSDNRQKTVAALNDLWGGNPIRRTRQGGVLGERCNQ